MRLGCRVCLRHFFFEFGNQRFRANFGVEFNGAAQVGERTLVVTLGMQRFADGAVQFGEYLVHHVVAAEGLQNIAQLQPADGRDAAIRGLEPCLGCHFGEHGGGAAGKTLRGGQVVTDKVITNAQGTLDVADVETPRQHLADDWVMCAAVGCECAVDIGVPVFCHQLGLAFLAALGGLDFLELPLVLRQLRQRQFMGAAAYRGLFHGGTFGAAGFFALFVQSCRACHVLLPSRAIRFRDEDALDQTTGVVIFNDVAFIHAAVFLNPVFFRVVEVIQAG